MKFIRKCPVLLLLCLSGLLLTVAAAVGRDSIYKNYTVDYKKMPALALVFHGVSDGIYPWDVPEITQTFRNMGGGIDQLVTAASRKVMPQLGQDTEQQDMGRQDTEQQDMRRQDTEQRTMEQQTEEPKDGLPDAGALQREGADGPIQHESSLSGNNASEAAGDGSISGNAEEQQSTYSFIEVGEDYFDDACFIGDSRTVGLSEYAGLEERATFYAKTSLTIYDTLTKPIVKTEDGRKITVEEALQEKKFGKIYLMVGINELGTGDTDSFFAAYQAVVERIRELQPQAVFFVEGIMRVTGEKNRTDPIFNNTNINDKNAAIARLADNNSIFYIDVNEAVSDENGDLISDYTADNVHLKAQYYQLWKEFLMKHGIVRE